MAEKPLYQDLQLKIDHHLRFGQDHILLLRGKTGEELEYVLERGFLEQISRTPRGGEAKRLVELIAMRLPYDLEREGITLDGLHVAICQAYAEQEKRYSRVG